MRRVLRTIHEKLCGRHKPIRKPSYVDQGVQTDSYYTTGTQKMDGRPMSYELDSTAIPMPELYGSSGGSMSYGQLSPVSELMSAESYQFSQNDASSTNVFSTAVSNVSPLESTHTSPISWEVKPTYHTSVAQADSSYCGNASPLENFPIHAGHNPSQPAPSMSPHSSSGILTPDSNQSFTRPRGSPAYSPSLTSEGSNFRLSPMRYDLQYHDRPHQGILAFNNDFPTTHGHFSQTPQQGWVPLVSTAFPTAYSPPVPPMSPPFDFADQQVLRCPIVAPISISTTPIGGMCEIATNFQPVLPAQSHELIQQSRPSRALRSAKLNRSGVLDSKPCPICPTIIRGKNCPRNFKRHMELHDKHRTEVGRKCGTCGKVFNRPDACHKHIEKKQGHMLWTPS